MKDFFNLLKEWSIEGHNASDLLEEKYIKLNELKIDEFSTYDYRKSEYSSGKFLGDHVAWEFEDRCGNIIIAVYIIGVEEFKSGYKVNEDAPIVFNPKLLKDPTVIKSCPDDRKINTIYKILINEIIPKYLLNKKSNKLEFNPVSKSRERIADMIMNKSIKIYPELKKKNNYLIYI